MKTNKKKEFSKVLLIQESALMWIHTLFHFILAFYCIYQGYTGSLPWLAASASFPWAAYGVSQVYYYKKSLAENTKDGIKYDAVITELNHSLIKNIGILNTNVSYNNTDEGYNTTDYVYTDTTDPDQFQI